MTQPVTPPSTNTCGRGRWVRPFIFTLFADLGMARESVWVEAVGGGDGGGGDDPDNLLSAPMPTLASRNPLSAVRSWPRARALRAAVIARRNIEWEGCGYNKLIFSQATGYCYYSTLEPRISKFGCFAMSLDSSAAISHTDRSQIASTFRG